MKTMTLIFTGVWTMCAGFWFTPDQQGQRLFNKGEFVEAAETFHDPLWQGTAWYRAGEFEKAALAFSRHDSAKAKFNQGNALLMHGNYEDAATCYEQALKMRPDWQEAVENHAIAVARATMVEAKGGDLGDQKIGADKIVFDKNAKNEEGQDTDIAGDKMLSNQDIQALWLRRVQTRPSDFFRKKFAYQLTAMQENTENETHEGTADK